MPITPSDLRAIPLFHRITDEHLRALLDVFERTNRAEGELLFEAGATAEDFLLLAGGEVSLFEGAELRFRLKPVSLIGELGALIGLRRNATARVSAPSEIWRVATTDLLAFFERHGDVAFPFYHNLLKVVAGKVRRDGLRLGEMRANLIRTQKAMKRVRELVLESEEAPMSKPIFDTLDELIEHNKRGHYTVEPYEMIKTAVRLDDRSEVRVEEMSDVRLHLAAFASGVPTAGSPWSGVLILGDGELPVSGKISLAARQGVVIDLDPLIPEYATQLADHLTRLQMLDYVV